MKDDKIKGGKADKLTAEDIADKFNVPVEQIKKELERGTQIELEHTDTKALAKEIALDHLFEFPDYYTRLVKMEKSAKKDLKESTKEYITRLLREAVELSTTDETSDTTTYAIKYNGRDAGQVVCGTKNDVDLEILTVNLSDDYQEFAYQIHKELIHGLWRLHPKANTIYVSPKPESRMFWAKLNANRLNNTYFIIQRGH